MCLKVKSFPLTSVTDRQTDRQLLYVTSYLVFFFQNATIDILHPLTELSSTGWVNCRDSPDIDQNARPVLLGDNIYAKGAWRDGQENAWKYNIPRKSWSIVPSPPNVDANDYTLAVYRSQLVWIGGRMHTGNKQESIKKIFTYEQGKGWKEDIELIPSIPDEMSLYSPLSASGDDNYLVVLQKSKLLLFDGKHWQQRDGPEHDIRSIFAHHQTLYTVVRNSKGNGFSFCKASMQSLITGNDSDIGLWKIIKFPYADDYSSLTLVGGYVAVVASIGIIPKIRCVLGFSSASDSWIMLTYLNINLLSVVGQPNGTLLLMGQTRMKDPSMPQNQSATAVLQFGMIEVAPNGMLSISVYLNWHTSSHAQNNPITLILFEPKSSIP